MSKHFKIIACNFFSIVRSKFFFGHPLFLSSSFIKFIIKVAFLFLILEVSSCHDDKTITANDNHDNSCNWSNASDSSSNSLIDHFWNSQSYYFNNNSNSDPTFNYWPQAHALDILIDAYTRKPKEEYLYYINKWHDGVRKNNDNTFLNIYYDDMEWNALAMLRVFNATNDEKWKLAVDTLWADIKTGWNSTMDGGISWNKEMPYYKNTPANAPACILAARLYQLNKKEEDKQWALKIYDWLKQHLLDGSGWVYDGLNRNQNAAIDKWSFTYNQGTFIGASLELYKITGDKSYLRTAVKVADYAIGSEVNANDYLLKDEGGGDGGLFKGIFIRYFTQLILNSDLDTDTRTKYIQFLQYNARALWLKGTNKQLILFGTYWKTKPGNETGLTEQMSGCMLIEAAALLNKQGLLEN